MSKRNPLPSDLPKDFTVCKYTNDSENPELVVDVSDGIQEKIPMLSKSFKVGCVHCSKIGSLGYISEHLRHCVKGTMNELQLSRKKRQSKYYNSNKEKISRKIRKLDCDDWIKKHCSPAPSVVYFYPNFPLGNPFHIPDKIRIKLPQEVIKYVTSTLQDYYEERNSQQVELAFHENKRLVRKGLQKKFHPDTAGKKLKTGHNEEFFTLLSQNLNGFIEEITMAKNHDVQGKQCI